MQGIVKHIVGLLHANTPQVKGRRFAGADHLSPVRTPDLMLPAVMDFLGRASVAA